MNKPLLLLALPIALMAACNKTPAPVVEQTTPPATSTAPAALDGNLLTANHWRLENATDGTNQRIEGLFVRADKPVTLDFRDGRVSVANTCNGMGGGFTLDGDVLTIAPMVSTQMACAEQAVMALDHAVSGRLEGPLKVQQLDATTLKLANGGGDVLTFRGEPTAEARHGGPGETVFLEIDAQTKPCPHPMIPDKQCLQVREVKYDDNGVAQGERGTFGHFYDAIEGYTHEAGVRNVVRVKRFAVQNPPADASSQAYVLDAVVASETVAH